LPLQSLWPPLDRPVWRLELTSLRFAYPSTASSSEPHGGAGVLTAPVPLSGFLNLSAVSQQARVPRPYSMPQPFLGFTSFRAFPSQESRTPLGATCSPVVIYRRAREHSPRPYYSRFHRRPRRAQLPGSPGSYGFSFGEPKPTSRSPWVTSSGTSPFRQLHPLRSLTPPASPVAPPRVAPGRRPMLSWRSTSPETSSPSLETSNPPRPRRPGHAP
jgi:hypothetical protein